MLVKPNVIGYTILTVI